VRENLAKSRQTPEATPDVQQQSSIAQDLQLLADFIADVAIIGVQFFQFALKYVNLGGGETAGRDAALRRRRR